MCIIKSAVDETIQVWVLYCQFAVDKMRKELSLWKDVFEHAVIACGQHVTKVMSS